MESDESESTRGTSSVSSVFGEEENEEVSAATNSVVQAESKWFESVAPYADQPLADEEWIKAYRERKQVQHDKYAEFKLRMDKISPVEQW